jgi:hypothetical protein
MRHYQAMLTAIAAVALLSGCETKMAPLDLSSAGLNATVNAPEGATVEKGKFGGVRIVKGESFLLDITARAAKLEEDKASCTGATHKNCEVISEQPDALITKWVQFSKDVHRIHANVTVQGKTYSCSSDSKSGVAVKKAEAERMLQTCKSITPKG